MQIKKDLTAVDRLLHSHRYPITIITEDVEDTLSSLNQLGITLYRDLSVVNSRVYIRPLPIMVEVDHYLNKVGSSVHGQKLIKKEFVDFTDSQKFYELFRGKNRKHKILSDGFSFARAQVLYSEMGDFETEVRELYVSLNKAKLPTEHHRKEIDHSISQLELGTFIQDYLLSGATDQYFLERLSKSKTREELLSARDATILDELNIGITKTDLNEFRRIRNAVMHFKVLTIEDIKSAYNFLHRFNAAHFENIILRAIKKRISV